MITSGYVVTNIQLLRAFGAAGLGVLANFGYPTYAVYDGPPLAGPRNYASAGGALANVGKYAA